MSTTDLSINGVKSSCQPVFEDVKSLFPSFMWAGVFGSVSRGTQTPDSDVDILVGFSQDNDFLHNVWRALGILKQRLPQVLHRQVDVIPFVEKYPMDYVHMEGLLTSTTIWGDDSWAEDHRNVAECLLREGFTAVVEALKLMRSIPQRLPSSKDEFLLPDNKQLRISISTDALGVIRLVKIHDNPFYQELQSLIPYLLANESVFQAYLEGKQDLDLGDSWNVLSDPMNTSSLAGMVQSGRQTFLYSGLGIVSAKK